MDNKISVTYSSITMAAAMAASLLVMTLIAVELLHLRFMGMGLIGLAVSVSLYLRGRIATALREREDAAFRLGRASHSLEKSALHSVQ